MQAEKKLSGGDGFWGFLSDKSGNDSDGADLLEKAANAFLAENSCTGPLCPQQACKDAIYQNQELI